MIAMSARTGARVGSLAPGDADAVAALLQMRAELIPEDGRSLYRMRQAVVEPVFGSIKELRCFRRFKLRGLNRARAEWQIICTTHNLLKLFRHHW